MTRPRLLDLFCGAGGAGEGYRRAGFDVVGVDIEAHDYPPGEFVLGDALDFLVAHGREFDAIHASPPCQTYSDLRHLSGPGHSDLVIPVRELLAAWGGVYVIENVEGAPLWSPLTLCGTEFGLHADCRDGRRRQLRRHRLFESNVFLMGAGGCRHRGQPLGVYGDGGGGQQTRGYKGYADETRAAMGIDWMNRGDLSQAIPPVFAEFIGRQLMAYVAAPPASVEAGGAA
jgi:DNA (cytosine-5)-methyltransferase 1